MKTRLIITWFCNLIDTFSTLYFYFCHDGEELNPVSAWLLQWPPAFVLVKLIGMAILVQLLLYKKEWLFCQIVHWYLFIAYILVALYFVGLYVLVWLNFV